MFGGSPHQDTYYCILKTRKTKGPRHVPDDKQFPGLYFPLWITPEDDQRINQLKCCDENSKKKYED